MRSPRQVCGRDNSVVPAGPGQPLVRIRVCGTCGTENHIAERTASDWQPFDHEIAGVI